MTIDPATLSQVIDVKNKIGTNADSSGTTSVFARLAQIAAYVDTLETSIGTNADASGTSTVFARLAQIAAYVDQVEGYTDTLETLLGLTGDVASGTGSVMARLAQLIAYTDTVETTLGTVNTNVNTANTNINTTNMRVGTNSDAAGMDTLFALLKKLDAKAIFGGGYTQYKGSFATASTTMVTALSVSGAGRLNYLHAFNANGKNVTVIVDGVTVINDLPLGGTGAYLVPVPTNGSYSNSAHQCNIAFKTSLQILMKAQSGTPDIHWQYELA
ncbi:hypothetical protein AB4114_23210 [Paenibacillus sp. 2RAB27]|uniref:hypothetical protein n=1 Tax=Paenibacillus sp. 2RAB27 TaxID=3232991 RepID=UPI003F9CF48F